MRYLRVIPAKAGTQASNRSILDDWPRLHDALTRGLCLADPWVPAFAGMTSERDPWVPAFAGMTMEDNPLDAAFRDEG